MTAAHTFHIFSLTPLSPSPCACQEYPSKINLIVSLWRLSTFRGSSVFMFISLFPRLMDLATGPQPTSLLLPLPHIIHLTFWLVFHSQVPQVLSMLLIPCSFTPLFFLPTLFPIPQMFFSTTSVGFISTGSSDAAVPEVHPNTSRQNVTPSSLWRSTFHMLPSSLLHYVVRAPLLLSASLTSLWASWPQDFVLQELAHVYSAHSCLPNT